MNTPKHSARTLTAAALALTAFGLLPGRAAPKAAPTRAAGESITIINTGDRLSPGYRVTVSPSGALQGLVRTRTGKVTINRKDQMIGPTRERLFEALKNAAPLDQLSSGGAAAAPQSGRPSGRRRGFGSSASPASTAFSSVTGPQVYVIYRGVRSPNLRAAGDDKGRELYQRVKQVIEVLRLPIPNVP